MRAGRIRIPRTAVFLLALAGLSAWRIWFQGTMPVFARPDSLHDDMLLVNYADSWLSGNAWGPYLGEMEGGYFRCPKSKPATTLASTCTTTN